MIFILVNIYLIQKLSLTLKWYILRPKVKKIIRSCLKSFYILPRDINLYSLFLQVCFHIQVCSKSTFWYSIFQQQQRNCYIFNWSTKAEEKYNDKKFKIDSKLYFVLKLLSILFVVVIVTVGIVNASPQSNDLEDDEVEPRITEGLNINIAPFNFKWLFQRFTM